MLSILATYLADCAVILMYLPGVYWVTHATALPQWCHKLVSVVDTTFVIQSPFSSNLLSLWVFTRVFFLFYGRVSHFPYTLNSYYRMSFIINILLQFCLMRTQLFSSSVCLYIVLMICMMQTVPPLLFSVKRWLIFPVYFIAREGLWGWYFALKNKYCFSLILQLVVDAV